MSESLLAEAKVPPQPHGQSFGEVAYISHTASSLPDLPEISVSHVNLTVREGDNAVITCNGSGSPLPDVDWIVTGLQSINTHQVGVPGWAPSGGWGAITPQASCANS